MFIFESISITCPCLGEIVLNTEIMLFSLFCFQMSTHLWNQRTIDGRFYLKASFGKRRRWQPSVFLHKNCKSQKFVPSGLLSSKDFS